jgi:hypothetical protein
MSGLASELGMNVFGLVGLIISFVTFCSLLIWIWTRPQKDMDAFARLIEDDEEKLGDV